MEEVKENNTFFGLLSFLFSCINSSSSLRCFFVFSVRLDWLCAQIANIGEWLIERTQKRKMKYIDDDELFEN